MEEIRGKTLKEWKDYCKGDNVPIMTMKYITVLEERIKQLTIPVVGNCTDCNTEINYKGLCEICHSEYMLKDKM